MDYLLKGDPISMIRLRKMFADSCEAHGVPLNSTQKTAVLTSLIETAKKAGLIREVNAPSGGV